MPSTEQLGRGDLGGRGCLWIHRFGCQSADLLRSVTGFDDNGIPLINEVNAELVVQHSNFNSDEDIQAAICAALTA